MTDSPLIFVIAGEPSGDVLGGRVMAALKELTGGNIRFAGIGGESMRDQGLQSLFPMEELSIMGVAEILPHLPRLLRRIAETARAVDAARPRALLTIDSPDFCRRVARRVHDRTIPRIHYVAPTVWAWRPWRAKGFARDFTNLLALLPFEPAWFERVGLACKFVGHPVVEGGAVGGDGAGFRVRHGIAPDEKLICVLPGSRRGEVGRLAGDFGAALHILTASRPNLRVVVPTVEGVAATVEGIAANWPGAPIVVRGGGRFDAMAASDVALAASGTVALELAMARVPTVIAYRIAPITHALVRWMIRVDFAHLINIIEGREIVPELIQGDCQPERLARELDRLLGPDGAAQVSALTPALEQLGLGGPPPSTRAAQAILDIIGAVGT